MNIRSKIEVMEAFERGEEIEVKAKVDRLNNMWLDSDFPVWNWKEFEYRIKPKQKQVVVIEKWLCYDNLSKSYSIAEESNIDGYISDDRDYLSKVRLLDTKTYEVGL